MSAIAEHQNDQLRRPRGSPGLGVHAQAARRPLLARIGRAARAAGWWLLLAICAFYAAFAIALGVAEILSWGGIVDATPRAVPIVFVAHALAGGVCLLAGALQFSSRLRARRPRAHRLVGRTYVSAVWIASTAGLWSAARFDVGVLAQAGFIAAAILWVTTTTLGLVLIRRGQVRRHREWMIRSFAVSLFFVTFEPWTATLHAGGLPQHIAYPVGLVTAWSVNLLIAEARIQATRGRLPGSRKRPPKSRLTVGDTGIEPVTSSV